MQFLSLSEQLTRISQCLFIDNVISAVLITGGILSHQSAEIYHPDRDIPCVIGNFPDTYRHYHTQDGSLLCGGGSTLRSCRRWNADTGAWDLVTGSLTENRWRQNSWTPADGSVTYLIGGYGSEMDGSDTTSEKLQHDNNKVSVSFPLKHRTR